ncbi:MAG: hypothetical protein QGI80_02560 [archaeon]|jgi:hypothetical protein|nr:hypothetical protein [archaeon]|tara:strand:- start:196 stop:1164 length:969 start_codon:yes stop_codon:yes gene_type:complete
MAETIQTDPQLTKELEELDAKIEPKEKEPQQSMDDENLIIEKDGELYLRSDSDEDESVAEPDGQTAEQENQATSEEEGQADREEHSQYQDKSKEQLIEMLSHSQKQIGEQGSEIGELRKLTQKDEELSDKEVFDKLSGDDIEAGLATEKVRLDETDPYDEKAVNEQKELIRQMEADLINKRTQENIRARFNSRDNLEFVDKMKTQIQSQGIELSDEEFNTVKETANSYAEDGLLNERSFQKAMIDKFGVDKLVKHYQMSGEQKARQDIQKAQAKTTEKVDVRGTGKNAKMVKVADLDQRELRETLDNLSVQELEKLYKQVNR